MCILSNIITYCMGEVDFMASSLKVSLSNLFSDLTPGLFINGSVISLEMCFHHSTTDRGCDIFTRCFNKFS